MLHKGSCHCKAIEFEIDSDLEKKMQCNCSICIRKNAKMIMVPKSNFKLLKGKEDLSLYQFNLNLAEHFFCKHCGIYTHHNRRTDPNGMGINLGCLDDVDPLDYEAGLNDGRKLS